MINVATTNKDKLIKILKWLEDTHETTTNNGRENNLSTFDSLIKNCLDFGLQIENDFSNCCSGIANHGLTEDEFISKYIDINEFKKGDYATYQEAIEYEHVGKPYDVTTLKPKFKIGKWYYFEEHIGKFSGWYNNDTISVSEYIYHGILNGPSDNFSNSFDNVTECPLEEIQQYLPKGHVDKIIDKKLTVDDLVKGEVYYAEYTTASFAIFKSKKRYSGAGINSKGTYLDSNIWGARKNLRLATPAEKQWLQVCIEANKFIPKDEALKNEPMENKFKVGDWVKIIQNSYGKDEIFKINNNHLLKLTKGYDVRWNRSEYRYPDQVRHATQSEIGAVDNPVKKPEFQFNKWYNSKRHNGLFFITSKNTGYGFSATKEWFTRTSDQGNWSLNNLIKATNKEVQDRLLAYAKEKYPVGTKFRSANQNNKNTDIVSTFSFLDLNRIYSNDYKITSSDEKAAYIFYQGKWATIIEESIFDRDFYVKVTSQDEAELMFDWLQNKGENVVEDVRLRKYSKSYNWTYIYFDEDREAWICAGGNNGLIKKKLSDFIKMQDSIEVLPKSIDSYGLMRYPLLKEDCYKTTECKKLSNNLSQIRKSSLVPNPEVREIVKGDVKITKSIRKKSIKIN